MCVEHTREVSACLLCFKEGLQNWHVAIREMFPACAWLQTSSAAASFAAGGPCRFTCYQDSASGMCTVANKLISCPLSCKGALE